VIFTEGGEVEKYDPNQPRDDWGRWTAGGGMSAVDSLAFDLFGQALRSGYVRQHPNPDVVIDPVMSMTRMGDFEFTPAPAFKASITSALDTLPPQFVDAVNMPQILMSSSGNDDPLLLFSDGADDTLGLFATGVSVDAKDGVIKLYQRGIENAILSKRPNEAVSMIDLDPADRQLVDGIVAYVVPHEMAHALDRRITRESYRAQELLRDRLPPGNRRRMADREVNFGSQVLREEGPGPGEYALRDDVRAMSVETHSAVSYYAGDAAETFAQLTAMLVQPAPMQTLNGFSRQQWFEAFPRSTTEVRRQLRLLNIPTVLDDGVAKFNPSQPRVPAVLSLQTMPLYPPEAGALAGRIHASTVKSPDPNSKAAWSGVLM
jgi:hypothetical protein